jgi:hypothetical protein
MPRNHHLLDFETQWSKKSKERKESARICSKISRKFHPLTTTPNITGVKTVKNNPIDSRKKIEFNHSQIESSSSVGLGVSVEEMILSQDREKGDGFPSSVNSVDLSPAKNIAIENTNRITNVLKRATEVDCRGSVLYGSSPAPKGYDSPEVDQSVQQNSPGGSIRSSKEWNKPFLDGLVIGITHNYTRPTTASTQDDRDYFRNGQQARTELARTTLNYIQEKNCIPEEEGYVPTRTDPWPYFYRMKLAEPVSRKSSHRKHWNPSHITGSHVCIRRGLCAYT